jgi:hypothetical protein
MLFAAVARAAGAVADGQRAGVARSTGVNAARKPASMTAEGRSTSWPTLRVGRAVTTTTPGRGRVAQPVR